MAMSHFGILSPAASVARGIAFDLNTRVKSCRFLHRCYASANISPEAIIELLNALNENLGVYRSRSDAYET